MIGLERKERRVALQQGLRNRSSVIGPQDQVCKATTYGYSARRRRPSRWPAATGWPICCGRGIAVLPPVAVGAQRRDCLQTNVEFHAIVRRATHNPGLDLLERLTAHLVYASQEYGTGDSPVLAAEAGRANRGVLAALPPDRIPSVRCE